MFVGVYVALGFSSVQAIEPSLVEQQVLQLAAQRRATDSASSVNQFIDPEFSSLPVPPPQARPQPKVRRFWQWGPIVVWQVDGQWFLSFR